MNNVHKELIKTGATIKQNEQLNQYTAYKIGGPADYFATITEPEQIPAVIEVANSNNLPFFMLGGGCNTVFSDKGFRGIIIHNKANKIEIHGSRMIAQSGVMLGVAIVEARKHELGGIVKLVGLPGTIGGAIYGNAGAQGVEIGDFVVSVKIFRLGEGIIEEPKEYFQFSYRTSKLKQTKEVVLEVTLDLPNLDPEDVTTEVMQFRAQKQPKGKVAGSFFKNPSATEAAGYLIDKAGLKGSKQGDIEVSEQHGNWLLNMGEGTQNDIVELARMLKGKVKEKFGIELEPENILIDELGNKIDI